jgi:hypothetical protein
MQKQLLTIAFIGIIIIGAVTAGGYYLGKVIQNPKTTPSPSDLPLINESVELPKSSLSPTPTEPALLPTAPPKTTTINQQQVQGSATVKKSTPITAGTGPTTTKDVSIRFIDAPAQIKSGQSFVVSWFVDGPVGMMGDITRLSSDFNSNGSSGSSSSTSSSQSFGAFQIPQKFQSNVTFSGNSGLILLKVTAEVNGKTYTATKSAQLIK